MTEGQERFVISNFDWLSDQVLAHALNCAEFFYMFCIDNVNVEVRRKVYFEDFPRPVDNIIYDAMASYYKAILEDDRGKIQKCPAKTVLSIINAKVAASIYIDDDYRTAESRLEELEEVYDTEQKEITESVFPEWLSHARIIKLDVKRITATELQTFTEHSVQAVGGKQEITTTDVMFEAMQKDEVPAKRIKTGYDFLDDCLDGGLEAGTSGLIIAPSGGGKTTICVNLAMAVALAGEPVLYISTEKSQNGPKLLCKAISAHANIPYSKINSKFNMGELSPTEQTEAKDFVKRISKTLYFYDQWNDQDLLTSLEPNIKAHIKKFSAPYLVIFDWLGGGLPDGMEEKKHQIIESLGKKMARLAEKYNFCGIYCSQGNTAQCEGRRFITPAVAHESKNLHQHAVWGFGISALKDPRIEKQKVLGESMDLYDKNQVMTVFKTRQGIERAFPIVRDFGFARFITKAKAGNPMRYSGTTTAPE